MLRIVCDKQHSKGFCEHLQTLSLGEGKKMKFNGGTLMFRIYETRSKTANVAEIKLKVDELLKQLTTSSP